ncbi:flavin-dependent dehydrogenase [Bradyrhizobium sp. LB7.1]
MAMNSATHIVSKASGATRLQADICVVGSGAAGSMAALTAATLGLKTVLVEAMPNVGGQLVGTLLGTICGLYDNGPRPRRLTFGPVDDLLKDLWQRNAIHARRALNTLVLQYDEALTGRWTERALRDAGVELVLGGVVRNASMGGPSGHDA